MTEPFRPDSPDEFFHDRRDWFRMDVMQNKHGGWAVVLVLDEGYSRESAEDMSNFFARKIARALTDVFNRDPDRNRENPGRWFGGSSEVLEQARRAYRESA